MLHLGRSNSGFIYGFSNSPLPSSRIVTDLGLKIDDSLSFSTHIRSLASKARSRCAVYFKTFISRDPKTMVQFYITYIRPLLEYCSVAWSPILLRDINIIESVQRYFSNRIPGCTYLPYKQRLARLSIESLQFRRTISDLVYLFSIVSGTHTISLSPYFCHVPPSVTRGHNLKLELPTTNFCTTKQNFLSRCIPIWNRLPLSILSSASKSVFRKKLSEYLTDPWL